MVTGMNSVFGRLVLVLLLLLCLAGSAGCGGKSEEEEKYTSFGVDNDVAGFLFHFDTREETEKMVQLKRDEEYPVKLRWAFETNGEAGGKIKEYSSTDPALIKDVYYGLSNVIIMGNALNHSPETPYYIELELADGSICRYNFVSLNTIRLSEQNYVLESDGNLWQTIRKASAES